MSDSVPSQSALAKLGDKIRNKLDTKNSKPATGKKAGKKDNKNNKNSSTKETFKKDVAKKDSFKKNASKKDDKFKPKKDFKKDVKPANPTGNNKDDKSVLLREIKAFGGDEKDLDLVADSDGEGSVIDFGDDSADKKDTKIGNKKSLDNDIFKFMNEIGLKGDGSSNIDVVADDDEDAEVPDLVEEKPKSKKEKKAEAKKDKEDNKVDKKTEKTDKKEKSDNTNVLDKKEKKEKTDERKPQFNQSTSNDIDQIMNEMATIESTESVFNASHSKYELILTPRSEWYNHELPEPKPVEIPPSPVLIERLYEKAKNLLAKENELFTHENNKSNSQKQFLSQLLTAGTLSDKIGAYSLLIQESPLHSVKYLTSLLSLCRKKSRGGALQSIAALKDIFVQGNVLPDRKLRWFKNQPGLSSFTSPELLIVWAFEDWLKQYFFSLIQILEEANLLRLGVNKLGDSDKKVASRVSYLLLQVQQAHPAMKNIIITSISDLLFRPGSDYHSRYYSVITLNQTIIAHKEVDVANSLMRTYLSLFERLLAEWNNEKPVPEAEVKKVKKPRWKNKGNKGKHGGERVMAKTSEAVKEEETNKLTSAILTGMNRAFPFSELPEDLLLSHINTLYRVTHSANFNTSVQALILLFQISKKDQGLSDRFYKTLYESLLDPRLSVSSKLRLYLNLLFKAIKQDVNIERVKAFAKRLVQISDHWLNVGVVAGVLYLLVELSKSTPRLRELIFNVSETKKLETKEKKADDVYDGKKRDPIFANAGNTKLWELIPMLHHFHPTIELYANSLVGKPQIGENGKPVKLGQPDLSLHGLSHFLDRFVYRNPKQKTVVHGSSIMQPLAGSDSTGLVLGADRSRNMKPVNINDWASMKVENVDVGERFFYNYFVAKSKREGGSKKKTSEKGGDLDEDGLNEDAVWKALVSSKPDIEADDMDDDLSMSDFSDIDDDEEDEEDVDLEDDDEDEDNKSAAAEDESDDDMKLDDEEGLLDSDEEISIGSNDEDDEAALEAMFEKELEKAGNKRALDSDNEEGAEASDVEEPQDKPAKKKSKKQKLKDLPVFASADDYAQFLGSSDDEDYS